MLVDTLGSCVDLCGIFANALLEEGRKNENVHNQAPASDIKDAEGNLWSEIRTRTL